MSVVGRLVGWTACVVLAAAPAAAQAPPGTAAVQTLTLKQAEDLALAQHPMVHAAEARASAAREDLRAERSVYFPSATAYLTAAAAASDSRIAAGGLNNPVIFDRFANGLAFNQFLTDFGRTSSLLQGASLHADADERSVDARRADILLQVDRAFFGALRARAVLTVAQKTVAARQVVDDQVQALARSKLKSALDVSFANVSLAEAKLDESQAENGLQAAFANLSAALGYGDTRTFDLQDEPLPTAPLPALDQEIASAMRHRPDLASQSLQRDSAMSLARAARDLWLPTVGLAGGAGIVPYRQDGLADRYSALGINVSVPVFNGALFSAQRAAATDRMQIEDERLHDLQNRIARDVRLAWLDANTGRQQLDLTSQLLTEANEALDLAQARYKLGLGSIVELTQAQLNQTKAETDQATARYDYQAAIATLDFQSGARP